MYRAQLKSKASQNSNNPMQSAHLSLVTKAKILTIYPRLKSLICLTSVFSLLLVTSCKKKETWFSCIENYKGNQTHETAEFFINISRTNGGIEANYIDANNSVRATTQETPITFNVSANIYPSVFKRRMVQTFYLINKKTLEFSKQVSPLDSRKLGKSPGFIGGISIQNAGTCKKLKRKP